MMTQGAIDIKRAVKGMVRICFVRKGEIWYETQHGELFSVPFADMGDASFNAFEKGMMLMRYMRKWNSSLANGHEATVAAMGGDMDIVGGPHNE